MYNLSDEILFGTPDSVFKFVRDNPSSINEHDQYGYTPLIETIICGKPELTAWLLAQGARVDMEDMLGQTALYWAADNAHLPLCELLLQKGADPNHATADGQPILVNPILRQQEDILALFKQHNADMQFAEDFINAKLIGHRYELVGQVDIVNAKNQFVQIDFEGFFLEFTIGLIRQTLKRFIEAVAHKKYPNYGHVLNRVVTALRSSSELVSFEYSRNVEKYEKEIHERTDNSLFLVPVAYEGHAITLVRYRNLFAKCDRGVNRISDTVIIYEMKKAYRFDFALIKKLLYQRGKTKHFISVELKEMLGLKPVVTLPTKSQLAGNCSWANVEACVPTMMFMLLAQGGLDSSSERSRTQEFKRWVMSFYGLWVEWEKDNALEECIKEFHMADRARKASKLDILGAIFAQRCDSHKPRELARAKKILPLLLTPDYQYILNSYLKVYSHRNSGPAGKKFMALLEACGVRI